MGAVIMCLRFFCFFKVFDFFFFVFRRCGLMLFRRFCITRSSFRICFIFGYESGFERAFAGAGLF